MSRRSSPRCPGNAIRPVSSAVVLRCPACQADVYGAIVYAGAVLSLLAVLG